jgi:hypothetical protein
MNLRTCHPDLQRVFRQVARDEEIEIIWGYRNKLAQNSAFDRGFSKVPWPMSPHNTLPSRAVDVMPIPIDWKNIDAFIKLAEVVKKVSTELGVTLRWGADWNRNGRSDDERFLDYAHWELVKKPKAVPPRPPIPDTEAA